MPEPAAIPPTPTKGMYLCTPPTLIPSITLYHQFPSHLQRTQATSQKNTTAMTTTLIHTHSLSPRPHTQGHQPQKNLASALLRSIKSTGFVT